MPYFCLDCYWVASGASSGPPAAIARISSVIFIEQYFGLQLLQKWALSVGLQFAHLRRLVLTFFPLPFVSRGRFDAATRFQNSS